MSQKKSYRFKLSEFNAETGEISGYANTFNFKDYAQDITMPGAFTASLKRHVEAGTKIKMLWQHDTTKVIGVWEEAYEDSKGLYLKGRLTKGVQLADEALLLLSAGALDGLSIGYVTIDSKYDSKQKANLLLEVELLETSIVTFPCNAQSRIDSVKSMFEEGQVPTEREMEKVLRDVGMSQKRAKAFLALGYKGLSVDTANAEEAETSAETASPVEETAMPQNINTNDEVEQETNSESLNETPLPAPFESVEVKSVLNHLLTLF
ncbi:HK97 family phage prohead protease [Aeromonas hydrophila]|uniref:HK97 family phage prohead protease n=1 Tax=Aeromonas hydrophila TaxID=644 RepID=A0AAX3PF93_AERHY|nr:HK97 family phage prohead protease [Aeromonas hydrophila]WEE28326.1 HK97 family phage prohead protease [Aeromonas hydrophila]